MGDTFPQGCDHIRVPVNPDDGVPLLSELQGQTQANISKSDYSDIQGDTFDQPGLLFVINWSVEHTRRDGNLDGLLASMFPF